MVREEWGSGAAIWEDKGAAQQGGNGCHAQHQARGPCLICLRACLAMLTHPGRIFMCCCVPLQEILDHAAAVGDLLVDPLHRGKLRHQVAQVLHPVGLWAARGRERGAFGEPARSDGGNVRGGWGWVLAEQGWSREVAGW